MPLSVQLCVFMISLILVHSVSGIGNFGISGDNITTCPEARVDCKNNGYMKKADCKRFLNQCSVAAFNRTSKCICPSEFYGTNCQFTYNKKCPPGKLYSNFGISKFGSEHSECQLYYQPNLSTLFVVIVENH